MTRTAIPDFQLANPLYRNATVNFYTVLSGVKTATLATLYSATTGTDEIANPVQLNSQGRFRQAVYIEDDVIGTIVGLSVPTHDTGIIGATFGAGLITGSGLTMSTSKVLGRTTAGTGAIQELSVSGTGSVAFTVSATLNSPIFVTPALGTPASGVLTNCTGTAAGLTAGNSITLNGTTFAAPGAIGGATPGAITGTTITATGQILSKDGDAASPGIARSAQPGTGFYFNNNTAAFSAGGTALMSINGNAVVNRSTYPMGWAAGADPVVAPDTAFSRLSAGVVGLGTGAQGSVAGQLYSQTLRTQQVAVASLPSAATAGAGARSFVTDANATTFLSTVAAGGANKVPVVSDGTNWLIG